MDIVLTHTSALALMRSLRTEGGGRIVHVDSSHCPRGCTVSAAREAMQSLGMAGLANALQSHPLEVAISDWCRHVSGTGLSMHLRSFDLPQWAYLGVCARDAASGRDSTGPRTSPRVMFDGPALALVNLAARLLPKVRAGVMPRWLAVDAVIALGYELCGTYARDAVNPATGPCSFGVSPITNKGELVAMLDELPPMDGVRLARRAAAFVTDGSASPMETLHHMTETLPPRLAGLSMGRADLNRRLSPNARQSRLLSIPGGMRPDLYWEGCGIAIEHEGAWHDSERAWKGDRQRIQDYQVMGIKVFPATIDDVRSVARLNAFALKICDAMAAEGRPDVGKRVRRLVNDPGFRARQRELLALLLPPVRDVW